MGRLYSNENFPLPVVEKLRALGHDVLTSQQAGHANRALPDKAVLAFAVRENRTWTAGPSIPSLPWLGRCGIGSAVITTPETVAFDRGVRPVLQIVLPDKAQALLKFRADPELQKRIEELACQSTEGQLTESERAEYEGYVRANKFVAVLQRQARQMIGSKL